ncbi:hypothetical protein [Nonomuraea sp. NPDC049695]|uniref:hypothetical protein n=1 Tax=Nonomuraea sp. NPDC049695 TaxID=3154734 RepID=UPI00343624BA
MTTPQLVAEGAGRARYTYRLRVSSTAAAALLAEWDRCRWIWNECVAKSKQVHLHNRAHPGDNRTCGPAQLDKMLTEARRITPWLRAGSSVPQQQIIRDFGRSRAKALKDIAERLPGRRGFGIKDGRLHLAGGIVLAVVWSLACPASRRRCGCTATASATGTARSSCPPWCSRCRRRGG